MRKRILYLGMSVFFVLGCREKTAHQEATPKPALSRQYRQDSVTVILSVSETTIPTSGEIQLMLEVHAPAGVEVIFPEIESLVEPFTVADAYAEPLHVLPNGKNRYRCTWVLLPRLPGETVFPAMEITAGPTTVKTEPVDVQVTSLLPADVNALEIKDIAAPVMLLPEEKRKQQVGLFVMGGIGILALLILVILRLRKPKSVQVVLPHEAAYRALENLPTDAVASIHELSWILRTYIEARFHLPILSKTAVECLPLIEDRGFVGLADFLKTVDRIRFSNKVPDGFQAEATRFVRAFVKATEEAPCD